MNNRKSLLTIVGILVGAIVIAVVMVRLRPEPPRRPPEPNTPFVTTEPVEAGTGPIGVFGSGTVRPRAEIDIAPEVGGKIVFVSPDLQSGGRVEAGAVLLRIDPADYENRVRQAEADVATQQVAVLQAEEEATIASQEYERFRTREAARGNRVAEPSALTLRLPQLEAARAGLARAEATLADARLALRRTEVRAPFAGAIRAERADVGAFVGPGQSVGQLYASDLVEVVVPVSDEDALLIPDLWSLAPGDDNRSITAEVAANYGSRRFVWSGYVDRAETALDEQSRTIDVVVRVPDPFSAGRAEGETIEGIPAPPLLVGRFAEVRIEGEEPENYFVVPRRALRTGNQVWTVDDGGRVRIVDVVVLQASDERLYVTGELTAGGSVITGGISVATDGMQVRTQAGAGR